MQKMRQHLERGGIPWIASHQLHLQSTILCPPAQSTTLTVFPILTSTTSTVSSPPLSTSPEHTSLISPVHFFSLPNSQVSPPILPGPLPALQVPTDTSALSPPTSVIQLCPSNPCLTSEGIPIPIPAPKTSQRAPPCIEEEMSGTLDGDLKGHSYKTRYQTRRCQDEERKSKQMLPLREVPMGGARGGTGLVKAPLTASEVRCFKR